MQQPGHPSHYIGLMSGTSLDGIDGTLVDFAVGTRLVAHTYHEFDADLRNELAHLNRPGWDDLHRASVAAQHLARAYASVVLDLLLHAEMEASDVRAIGAHGQTVRHRPDEGYTLQLNAPASLAELTDIDVVADFRSRDVAAGGQGAPLVPAFHADMFAADEARAIVNIGGIANVTLLPRKSTLDSGVGYEVIGFDTGPGNVLIDHWMSEHQGAAFDRDGAWAATGKLDRALLERLLDEPFFAQAPPRSTGRDQFNPDWLSARLHQNDLPSCDVQATLTRLTAISIGQAIKNYGREAEQVIVCGGGARNAHLMQMLGEEVGDRRVHVSDTFGIAAEHVEAMAFAWLARASIERRAGNIASVTGARGPRILGAIYPGRLMA